MALDSEVGGDELDAELEQAVAQRADDVSEALQELSGVLLGSETLEQTLQRVVDLAVRTVPGCDGASVTLLEDGRASTAAATDDVVRAVDRAQYDVGDGPCLDAARHRRRNSVDLAEAGEEWPDFVRSAREAGFCSFLAAPLTAGEEGIGALNLYSRARDGFGALDEALVALFSAQASVALANAQAYDSAVALGHQLSEAMASRAVIEQAKGALMVTRGVSGEQAFDLLREWSQRTNRKLREVAAEVLDRPSGGRSGTIAPG